MYDVYSKVLGTLFMTMKRCDALVSVSILYVLFVHVSVPGTEYQVNPFPIISIFLYGSDSNVGISYPLILARYVHT